MFTGLLDIDSTSGASDSHGLSASRLRARALTILMGLTILMLHRFNPPVVKSYYWPCQGGIIIFTFILCMSNVCFNELMRDWWRVCVCMCIRVLCLSGVCFVLSFLLEFILPNFIPVFDQKYTWMCFFCHLYAPQTRSGGILFLPCLFDVCLSICLFQDNFNIGHNFWAIRDRDLIFSMNMHLLKLHILKGNLLRSRSSFKVKGQIYR